MVPCCAAASSVQGVENAGGEQLAVICRQASESYLVVSTHRQKLYISARLCSVGYVQNHTRGIAPSVTYKELV